MDLPDQWVLLVPMDPKVTQVFVEPEEDQAAQEMMDLQVQTAERVNGDHEAKLVHVTMEHTLKDCPSKNIPFTQLTLIHQVKDHLDHWDQKEFQDQMDHMEPLEVLDQWGTLEQWENQERQESWAPEVKMELTVSQEVEENQDQVESKESVVCLAAPECLENQENEDTRE